jgi:hypothetical protein
MPPRAGSTGDAARWGAFALFFGALQALYFAAGHLGSSGADIIRERGPDKKVIILDGSGLEGDSPPPMESLLQNPAAVLTFDSDGNRKPNELEQKDTDREREVRRQPSTGRQPSGSTSLPPPPSNSPAEATLPTPVAETERSPTLLPANALTVQPPSPASPYLPITPRPAAIDDTAALAAAHSELITSPPARRPSYVWAQNRTHAFVTVSLTAHERDAANAAQPRVVFDSGGVHVAIPVGDGVLLELKTFRPVVAAESSWRLTRRGVLCQLRKRIPGHWMRLLPSGMQDALQGIDWTRWNHPDATRAEADERNREEFEQRNEEREAAIAKLRPRFSALLQHCAGSQERGEILEPAQQLEMLRLGEEILTHYRAEREERSALLGDAPLPAGVDEEQLERSLIGLRELERRGQLAYDRNSVGWKEFRRRQKEREAFVAG